MYPGVELAGTVWPTVGVSTLLPTDAAGGAMIAGPTGPDGSPPAVGGTSGVGPGADPRERNQIAPAAPPATSSAITASNATSRTREDPRRGSGGGPSEPNGGRAGGPGGGPAARGCSRGTPTVGAVPGPRDASRGSAAERAR